MLSADEMTRPCAREAGGTPSGVDVCFRARYGWKEMITFRGKTLLYIFNSLIINILTSLKKNIWNGPIYQIPCGLSY